MNPIKAWLWRKNAIKVVKQWFEDKENSEWEEIHRQVKDWAAALDAALPHYDGYVEYENDNPNSRNLAESLMWERLKAKHGHDVKIEVSTLEVPAEWNSIWVRMNMCQNRMDLIKKWRLYYMIDGKKNKEG